MKIPSNSFLLVPAYDVSLLPAVEKAAGRGVRLVVILNPDSGPGKKKDAAYAEAAKRLQAQGVRVLGYVDCHSGMGFSEDKGKRRMKEAKRCIEERDRWRRWYGVQGIFWDDAVNYLGRTLESLFQSVKPDKKLDVMNPGTKTALAGCTCITWEQQGLPTRTARAYMALGVPSLPEVIPPADLIYLTDLRYGNQYERLPKYWDALCTAFT